MGLGMSMCGSQHYPRRLCSVTGLVCRLGAEGVMGLWSVLVGMWGCRWVCWYRVVEVNGLGRGGGEVGGWR